MRLHIATKAHAYVAVAFYFCHGKAILQALGGEYMAVGQYHAAAGTQAQGSLVGVAADIGGDDATLAQVNHPGFFALLVLQLTDQSAQAQPVIKVRILRQGGINIIDAFAVVGVGGSDEVAVEQGEQVEPERGGAYVACHVIGDQVERDLLIDLQRIIGGITVDTRTVVAANGSIAQAECAPARQADSPVDGKLQFGRAEIIELPQLAKISRGTQRLNEGAATQAGILQPQQPLRASAGVVLMTARNSGVAQHPEWQPGYRPRLHSAEAWRQFGTALECQASGIAAFPGTAGKSRAVFAAGRA